VAKFTAGLEKLLDALAPTKTRIVLMSPTPFEKAGPVTDPEPLNKNLALYRDVIKATARKRELEFFDLYEILSNRKWPGESLHAISENGIHYTPAGYAMSSIVFSPDLMRQADRAPSRYQVGALLELDKKNALQAKIVEKNQLFFHRWRPQNETYLFGFRKHEQGKNAAEVAAFDPLVAKAEKEIAELKKAIK
jgi:hypothetical protein